MAAIPFRRAGLGDGAVDSVSAAEFNWSVVPPCAFPLDVEAGGQALMLAAGLQAAGLQEAGLTIRRTIRRAKREANTTNERPRWRARPDCLTGGATPR